MCTSNVGPQIKCARSVLWKSLCCGLDYSACDLQIVCQTPGMPSRTSSDSCNNWLACAWLQPGQKKSVEELAAQQGFGTEPGGELGRQDPGPRLGGAGGGELAHLLALAADCRTCIWHCPL